MLTHQFLRSTLGNCEIEEGDEIVKSAQNEEELLYVSIYESVCAKSQFLMFSFFFFFFVLMVLLVYNKPIGNVYFSQSGPFLIICLWHSECFIRNMRHWNCQLFFKSVVCENIWKQYASWMTGCLCLSLSSSFGGCCMSFHYFWCFINCGDLSCIYLFTKCHSKIWLVIHT